MSKPRIVVITGVSRGLGRAMARASVGLVRFPEHSVDPGELVKYADIAMYAAKVAGKNRFSKFRPDMLKGI